MRASERTRDDEWAEVLHASAFYTFGWLRNPRTLVLRRTAQRYPDLTAVRSEIDRIVACFPSERPKSLVVDMRQAPPSNDPAFEQAMRSLRTAVAQRVDRVVLLVSTASGVMQVARLQRAENTTFQTSRDEREALALASEE